MEAARKLYEAYRLDVFRYLVSLTRDTQLAEELLSETFLSAIIALPGYRGDGDPKAWLFKIARNKWIDALRHQAAEAEPNDWILIDPLPGPEAQVQRKILLERAMALLRQEDHRAAGILSMRLRGYSFYEISKSFGIREGSARVIDFRARQKLREILEQEGYCETV